jgi:hypothetical protein
VQQHVGEASPDMSLICPVPLFTEVILESLFPQLCQVINGWINETNGLPDKHWAFPGLVLRDVESVNEDAEAEDITDMTEQSYPVDSPSICLPFELYQVDESFAPEYLEFTCLSTGADEREFFFMRHFIFDTLDVGQDIQGVLYLVNSLRTMHKCKFGSK